MAHFVPLRGLPTAPQLAKAFMDNVFRLHGLPSTVISDRGPQMTARFWRAFAKLLRVGHNFTSAFHPEGNGLCERVNATISAYLRRYVDFQQSDWVSLLPIAEFAYNSAVHSSHNLSPFQVVYGAVPHGLPPLLPAQGDPPAISAWADAASGVWKEVGKSLAASKAAMKQGADSLRAEGPLISVGDKVYLSTKNLKSPRPCKKLDFKYLGPFEVLEVLNPVSFRLRLPSHMRIHNVFHRSLLFPCPAPSPFRPDPPPPPPMVVDGNRHFEVGEILDSRISRGRLEFFIHWKGFPPSERSWVASKDVAAPRLVSEFFSRYPGKPGAPSTFLALSRGEEGGGGGEGGEEGMMLDLCHSSPLLAQPAHSTEPARSLDAPLSIPFPGSGMEAEPSGDGSV